MLLVEDDELVRMAIMDGLEDNGFEVIGAKNSETALAIIETDQPLDLLITDIGLPGVNGHQLAGMARIRRPGLKVLFLTGYSAQTLVETLPPRARVVEKPIDLNTLSTLIGQMLNEP